MRRLLLLLFLLPLAVSSAAHAQDATEAERLREIERLREEKARDVEALRSRTEQAAATLRQLKARLVDTAESLQDAEASATEAEAAIARLTRERREAQSELQTRRRSMSNVLAALQSLERSRPPALVVSPEDANRAATAAVALSAVTPEIQSQAAALRADLDRIEALRLEAERERLALSEAESALAERRRLLEDLLAERERRQAADVTRLRRIEREDAALAREASTLRELIEGIDRRDEAREPEAPPPSLPTRPRAQPEVYAALPASFADAAAKLPLPAAGRIVTRFGDSLEGGGRAQELVLATRPGAVVTAPFGGTVKWAKPYGALGNIVILDVGDGYSVVLMGLGSFAVRRDDEVRAGEPLGYMDTGGERALRLHIRRQNEALDPEPWLLPGMIAQAQ
ncbi:murein hydrolase activator EnvC family protein [Parvularcula oceani]|uniref:murein hydrolase activator EnvC family protein n=1 Tax=Parvularcula oceani TaxID=1247963 RepID=UPI0004E16346|nr:peptidoglycan DD-metalloendopeptidase family protein [Parvularcula oceani]